MNAEQTDVKLSRFLNMLEPEQLDRLKILVDARTATPPPPPTNGPETYRGVSVPETLHHNWDQLEAHWWRAGVVSARTAVEPILLGLDDGRACILTYENLCHTHGEPVPACPVGLARQFIADGRGAK